jgi:ParB family chromosome partitioning protein
MSVKKRGLGRGLDALLGSTPVVPSETEVQSGLTPETSAPGLRHIPVDQIERGQYQPRQRFDEEALEELAASIKQHGLMQPVVVTEVSANRFQLIAGERRWRASQRVGLATIPAVVKVVQPDQQLAMALIENIQRENLNPMEEAIALSRLIEEFQLTHQAVADSVGKSRTAVTNAIRLTRLSKDAAQLVAEGLLDMGHGRALLALPVEQQGVTARRIAEKGLSVRQAESLVRKMLAEPRSEEGSPTKVDPDVIRLEQQLTSFLGQRVSIKQQSKSKGQLSIRYDSLDELDGILSHMGFQVDQ